MQSLVKGLASKLAAAQAGQANPASNPYGPPQTGYAPPQASYGGAGELYPSLLRVLSLDSAAALAPAGTSSIRERPVRRAPRAGSLRAAGPARTA